MSQNDGEDGEHKDFLCSLYSLLSQHEIKPVSWCGDLCRQHSSLRLAAQHEWRTPQCGAPRLPRAPEMNGRGGEREGGSLLTLRSGCCRDRHRRDIARYCRLSHKAVKRRREMRSSGPVPSLASRSKTVRRLLQDALIKKRNSVESVQRTISRLAKLSTHFYGGALSRLSPLTRRVQKGAKVGQPAQGEAFTASLKLWGGNHWEAAALFKTRRTWVTWPGVGRKVGNRIRPWRAPCAQGMIHSVVCDEHSNTWCVWFFFF